MKFKRGITLTSLLAIGALVLSGCGANGAQSGGANGAASTVKVRLWDDNAAEVYKEIAADFTKANPNYKVEVETVPWADYFSGLRQELASGGGPDLFWLNSANIAAYAEAGQVVPTADLFDESEIAGFAEPVVSQYTVQDKAYGVPQIYDGAVGLYYNADLLQKAGVDPSELQGLKWSASGGEDTLLPLLKKLTLDSAGRNAADPEFDENNIVQYGFNAGWELQAIVLPFIGSNGGTFQNGDEFTFTNAKTAAAFQYITDLINVHHVAPPAEDTNNNGDFSRDTFLQGKMAIFQSGTYNLANISEGATFNWGVAALPAGDAGQVTVAPGVVMNLSAKAANNEAAVAFAKYIATPEANVKFGEKGVAFPAVTAASAAFNDYWSAKKVDAAAFEVPAGAETIAPVSGLKFSEAANAFMPIMSEMLLGNTPVNAAMKEAEKVANEAVNS